MLGRSLIFAGVIAVVATQIPSLLEKTPQSSGSGQPALGVAVPQRQAVDVDRHGNVRLLASGQGHYSGDFRINGKPVQGLIDTGATFVTLNESTARRLGFSATALDYRYSIDTANGATKAAYVKLDRIEIGTIKVRDVEAIVLKDEALGSTLIGVSFLKKLASYSVEDGSLHLVE